MCVQVLTRGRVEFLGSICNCIIEHKETGPTLVLATQYIALRNFHENIAYDCWSTVIVWKQRSSKYRSGAWVVMARDLLHYGAGVAKERCEKHMQVSDGDV